MFLQSTRKRRFAQQSTPWAEKNYGAAAVRRRATIAAVSWGRIAMSLLLGAALQAVSPSARADQPNAPDWAFGEPAAEAAITAGSALTVFFWLLPQNQTDWEPSPVRPRSKGYSNASDYSGGLIGGLWQMAGSWALESSYYVSNDVRDGQARALRSALINLDAINLATGISMVLKRVTGRCRPRAFRRGRCDGKENNGFPSGHTVVPSAVAGSNLLLALRSGGDPTHRYLAFGFAEGASLLTAVLRVMAGAHSWDDVLSGYFIGHATGAVTSLAHPMQDLEQTTGQASGALGNAGPSTGLSWSSEF
jgi:membrane-associated phospholipid phosphatase